MTRRDLGPLVALAAVIAGLLLGERAGGAPARVALAAGVIGIVGAWLVDGPTRVVVAALALGLLGTAVMQRALDGLARNPLAAAVASGEPVTLGGVLVSDPAGQRFGADALLRVDGFARIVLVRADRNRREPPPRARGRGPRRRGGPPHAGAAYRVRCTRAMGSRRRDPHRHRRTRLPPRAAASRPSRTTCGRSCSRGRSRSTRMPGRCSPASCSETRVRSRIRSATSTARRACRISSRCRARTWRSSCSCSLRCCAGSRCCRARDSRSPSSSVSRRPRASNRRCSARPRSRA